MTTTRGNLPLPGSVVYLCGKEFKVEEPHIEDDHGVKVVRFKGICTESDRNDGIRGGGYDGAWYGWTFDPEGTVD